MQRPTCPKARPAYPPGHLPVPRRSAKPGAIIGASSMAQRPIWRGHLRLALVSCPVALYSAQHDRNTIRFNMINPDRQSHPDGHAGRRDAGRASSAVRP